MTEDKPFDPVMAEDEYNRGQLTQQFIDQATEATNAVVNGDGYAIVKEHDDGTYISTGKITSDYGARDNSSVRANRVVRELSDKSDNQLDYEAAKKLEKLHEKANRVNEAHDTVTSGAANSERDAEVEDDITRKLGGNNSVGGSQELGSMARSATRKYDIKGGIAMRAASHSRPGEDGGMLDVNITKDGAYEPFPDSQQEAAKTAIKGLAVKQVLSSAEKERRDELRAAKAVLGRAGVKIPKEPEVISSLPPEPVEHTNSDQAA